MKLFVIFSLLALSGSVVASSPTGISSTHGLQSRQTKCGGEDCDDKTQECKEVDNKPKCVCKDGYALNMDQRCVSLICDTTKERMSITEFLAPVSLVMPRIKSARYMATNLSAPAKMGKSLTRKENALKIPARTKSVLVMNRNAGWSTTGLSAAANLGISPLAFAGIAPRCVCKSGTTPTRGRGCVKNDELESCDLTYCGVYAECRVVDENPTCVCKAGSHRVKGRCGPDRNYCGGLASVFSCPFYTNEKCIWSNGERICVCPDGYHFNGKNECVEDSKTDPCESVQCGSNRECKEIGGDASCVCKEGYKPGPNHSCVKESSSKREEPEITDRKLADRLEDRCGNMVCGEGKACEIRDGKPVCRSSAQK
ncbi:unnamed protein product [Rhizoctonia solani]|uniref:EGF-like domain-containing protein n=1 Tax=Rhizoctonia solani TaxID=456999 RepID=A0A8H3BEK2_9AGAM|nr:unnamed protein product [Rhizoctonia solani]